MTIDVAIIGAGISGMFAAYALECEGYGTVILEKSEKPYNKPCGGMARESSIELFKHPELIGDIDLFSIPPKVPFSVNGIRMGIQFYNISREKIYQHLSRYTSVMVGTSPTSIVEYEDHVDVMVGQDIIQAKYIIGADGVFSQVRKMFGPAVPSIPVVQYTVDPITMPDCFDMIFDKDISPDYYIWIIPSDGKIRCGTSLAGQDKVLEYVNHKYGIKSIEKTEHHSIAKISSQNDILAGSKRILLVGEAAGLVRPATGEGIYFALASSRLAVDSIINGINYEKAIKELGVI